MTSNDQDRDHILIEVVTDPRTMRATRWVSIVTRADAASVLARCVAEDVLEELDAHGCGADVQALAEVAGDSRQSFAVYSREQLRYLDRSDDLGDVGEMGNVDMEAWKAAEEAGWLADNEAEEVDE
jgi:hypothetical protein